MKAYLFRTVVTAVFIIVFTILLATKVSAHISGIPFLKINGKYAPANTSYFSSPELKDNIPQDMGAEKYLVGQLVTLEIDTTQIPVQKELIAKAVFRWSWEDGSTSYDFGLKVSHSYNKKGSHLASLDIKAPSEATFTPYDTIQFDVVENFSYQTPSAVIYVNAKELKTGQPINFNVQFNTNPQVKINKYYWFIENQKLENQPSFDHTFTDKDFFQLAFLKFTDSGGFSAYRGAWLEGTEGNIQLSFPPNSHAEVEVGNTVPIKNNSSASKTTGFNSVLYGGLAVILVGVGIGAFMRRGKK